MPKPTATVSATPVTGDAKERLLAEQTAKYQATLTAAMDELMATQAALEERKTVPGLIDKDLARVGTLVYERVKKLLHQATPGSGKAVRNALLLMPIRASLPAGGLGTQDRDRDWRPGVSSRVICGCSRPASTSIPLFGYLIVAGVCFYFERRAQTSGIGERARGQRREPAAPVAPLYPSGSGAGARYGCCASGAPRASRRAKSRR